jgi:hypothetical protein
MFQSLLALLIGIAVGVIFHAAIKPLAVRAWQRFRAWRKNATRQV